MAKDDFKVKKGLVVGKGIVADSDVTANAFIGDGSQLTNLDYSNISSNLPNILDSGNVSALIDSADTHDSAAVLGQITSTVDGDYVKARMLSADGGITDLKYSQYDHTASTITFTVTVDTKTSNHRYYGTGSGSAYFIEGDESPFIQLVPGNVYRFDGYGTNSGHPLKFYLEADRTTQYTTGVTEDFDYTEISVTETTPTVLYYQCSAHAYMGNAVHTMTKSFYGDSDVNILIAAIDTHDSAAVQAQFDSNFTDTITITKNSTTDPALILQTTADGSNAAPIMEFIRNTSQANNGDYLGQIKFRGEDSGGSATTDIYAKITGKISDATDGTEDGLIEYAVKSGGSNTILARMTGAGANGRLDILNGADISVATGGDITVDGNSVLTTASTYVQSVTAGSGIKSIASASTPTVTVDSGFVTGLFTGGDGISYSGGTIALDPTDSATFANVTATNEIRIKDSANGSEVSHLSGDPNLGLVIHSHAHATDGGIRFVIHDTADSDFLVINRTNGISFENRRVRNIADPTADQDAASKAYVDAVAEGLHVHAPTRAATVGTLASITGVTSVAYDSGTAGVGSFLAITGSLDSIDGVALASADRLLIKNETNQAFNGIYVWDSATRITRALDFDTPAELAGGDFVFNQEGTVNADAGFVQTETLSSIGDSAVIFVQFSGAGQITAGDGLSKTGNELDVDLASASGLEFSSNQLKIKPVINDYTINLSASGIKLSQADGTQGGIANEHINYSNTLASGLTPITINRLFEGTLETLDSLAAHEGATYKFYTTARGDSDTRALVDSDYVRLRADSDYVKSIADSDYIKTVTSFPSTNLDNSSVTVTAGKGLLNGGSVSLGDTITIDLDSANIQSFTLDSGEVINLIDSAYVRPLARAAIVAGTNITYDSATGVISGAASLTVKDEGSILTTSATALNFVGPGVTATGSGTEKTITIEGSAPSFAVALNLLDSTGRAGTDIPSALGVGDPVFYDSDAGYWTGAKADSASTASHVIVEYSTSNSNFKIAQTGVFTLDSNSGSPTFLDNSYYYISDSSGVPTPTQPTTGIFQALYYALDSDTIDINLGDPVEIGVGTTDVEQFPAVSQGATVLTLTQSIDTARTDVFKNGVLLREGASQDYAINSPTQITMVDALDDSDLISVRSTVLGTTLNTATTVISGTTASAPNPSVTGDANTGLFSAAADTVSIATGGSERLKVTNSGIEVTGTISGASGIEVTGTISGGPTIDSATISGDLTLTGGVGIPNVATLSDISLPSVTTYYIDSGNVAKLITADSAEIHINTHDANFANYIGTSFSIMVENNGGGSIDVVTKAGKSGDTVFFNTSNLVTISTNQFAIISGMVFDADNLLINSIHLDSDITT